MCIKPKGKIIVNVPQVYLNDRKIDLVKKYKYLGMIMCDVNKDDEALASQIRGLYSRDNALIKNFFILYLGGEMSTFQSFLL